jgi:hypothetical protein
VELVKKALFQEKIADRKPEMQIKVHNETQIKIPAETQKEFPLN